MSVKLDSLKRFALAVLKIACGLSLAAILLGLGAWGVITLLERSEEAAKAPLATPKDWSEVTAGALADTKFTLRTVWRREHLYYQFQIHAYPPEIAQARESDAGAAFIIDFLDGNGFRLFQKVLELREMTRAVGSDRKIGGLSWKGDEYLGADVYRRAESWELRWSGFPEVKVAAPVEKRTTKSPARQRFQLENWVDKKPRVTTKDPPKPVTKKEPKWKVLGRWRTLIKGYTKQH